MSNPIINPAWKYKKEIKNIFDENFLNEKDLALEPINFFLEENNNINNNTKSGNISASKIKNKKEEKPKKKSLKNSGLYSSNIIIVQSIPEGDSNDNSFNQIEKEVEKINKLITRNKSKKNKKNALKQKGLNGSNSAKFEIV